MKMRLVEQSQRGAIIKTSVRVFLLLVSREIKVFGHHLHWHIFDSLTVAIANTMVFGYMLPLLGVSRNYGAFTLVGGIVAAGLFNAFTEGLALSHDLAGARRITYELTLPMPSWLVFFARAVVFALHAALLNILMIPVGKIILHDRFDFSHLSWLWLCVSYIVVHFLLGVLAVWMAAVVQKPSLFRGFRNRLIVPLLIFGGEQFPWRLLAEHYPRLALVNLANPLVYPFEVMRASVFGAQGYLPFWLSIAVIVAAIVVFMIHALYCFKRRLDFV